MATTNTLNPQDIHNIVITYAKPYLKGLPCTMDDVLQYKLKTHYPDTCTKMLCHGVMCQIRTRVVEMMRINTAFEKQLAFPLPSIASLRGELGMELATLCIDILEMVLLSAKAMGVSDVQVNNRLDKMSCDWDMSELLVMHVYTPNRNRTPDFNRRIAHFFCLYIFKSPLFKN